MIDFGSSAPSDSSMTAVGDTRINQTFGDQNVTSMPPWLQMHNGADPLMIYAGAALVGFGLVYLLWSRK